MNSFTIALIVVILIAVLILTYNAFIRENGVRGLEYPTYNSETQDLSNRYGILFPGLSIDNNGVVAIEQPEYIYNEIPCSTNISDNLNCEIRSENIYNEISCSTNNSDNLNCGTRSENIVLDQHPNLQMMEDRESEIHPSIQIISNDEINDFKTENNFSIETKDMEDSLKRDNKNSILIDLNKSKQHREYLLIANKFDKIFIEENNFNINSECKDALTDEITDSLICDLFFQKFISSNVNDISEPRIFDDDESKIYEIDLIARLKDADTNFFSCINLETKDNMCEDLNCSFMNNLPFSKKRK